MKHYPLMLLFSFLSFLSFSKDDQPLNAAEKAVLLNVSYGNLPKQQIDVYLPANRNAATRTFVLIHGGGWMGGDKKDMKGMVDSLQARFPDCAFVNVNYRLVTSAGANGFPVPEQDVKNAIDFYLSKSAEYTTSQDLILFGVSAGAHLAMLYGYKHDAARHVKVVIDGFGPADFVAAWNNAESLKYMMPLLMGSNYSENPALYLQSSPINFISAESPPTIALQGGADPLIAPSQTDALINRLKEEHVENELVFYPTEGHGWTGARLTDSYNKVEAFIRKQLK